MVYLIHRSTAGTAAAVAILVLARVQISDDHFQLIASLRPIKDNFLFVINLKVVWSKPDQPDRLLRPYNCNEVYASSSKSPCPEQTGDVSSEESEEEGDIAQLLPVLNNYTLRLYKQLRILVTFWNAKMGYILCNGYIQSNL